MPLARVCNQPRCLADAAPGSARCTYHARQLKAEDNARRRASPGDGAARRLRARMVKTNTLETCAECNNMLWSWKAEVDHIVALADGGHDVAANLQLLCAPCHYAKTTAENRARREAT